MQMQLLNELRGFHGDGNSGRIVDGPGSQIPGVEVAGDNDDLFRVPGAFEIRDDVVTQYFRTVLRSKGQMHLHCSLGGETREQVSVFAGDGAGRDTRRRTPSGVRQAVVCAANRADHAGNGTQFCGGLGAVGTIIDGFPISITGQSIGGFPYRKGKLKATNLPATFSR